MQTRSAETYIEALTQAGFRQPTGYPRSIRSPIRGMLLFAQLNASTNIIDLTQGWTDVNVLRAGGTNVPVGNGATAPVNNPSTVVVIERAAIVVLDQAAMTAAQSDLLMASIHSTQLVHQPSGGDPREVPLIQLLDSVYAIATAAIAVGPLNVATQTWQQVETHYLPLGPMWVDLQHDVFGLKLGVSRANGTPNMALVFDGACFNNQGWISADNGGQCEDGVQGTVRRLGKLSAMRDRVHGVLGTMGRVLRLK